jgi:hypothetical protein
MNRQLGRCAVGGLALAIANIAAAGTDTYFIPLTQSAAVADIDSFIEMNHPWVTAPGISQKNLTSLNEAETSPGQSMGRAPGAGTSATMLDMSAYSPDGRFVFMPHESPWQAGATRYDMENDFAELIFAGDGNGVSGDWSNDYGAFDPSSWTPNDTLLLAEEWTGEGRVIEILNPLAPVGSIQTRELESIVNVAHEGLRFSDDGKVLYFVDEWNSGSLYKIVFTNKNDYAKGGRTYVLSVDAFNGVAADNWDDASNTSAPRTGYASWVPITDHKGAPLTSVDPFRNGPTNDPRTSDDTRGGRPAADEVNATPYGRPEDMEIGRLANGREVIYFAATSERSIYSIEELKGSRGTKAMVRLAASDDATPKNLGFPATTGVMNSPDNLAQDALGNIYIIEDAPNGSSTGGDIWFMRDVNTDGVAESIDHFMSIQIAGSEATGMEFNPVEPTEFVVTVQHPDSTALDANSDSIPDGFGDALWKFELDGVMPPPCQKKKRYWFGSSTCVNDSGYYFIALLERAGKPWWKWW